jgi:hypothetical protein
MVRRWETFMATFASSPKSRMKSKLSGERARPMSVDGKNADPIEELAEIAGAFLGELGGDRVLVVHGDEFHPTPVTQVFGGLTYEGIEALLFDWSAEAEENTTVFLEERYGRQCLVAPLRDASGDCVGMLYADTSDSFAEDAVESLDRFARHYVNLLLEICPLYGGPWKPAPIDEEGVPPEEDQEEEYQEPPAETDESWIDESWDQPEDGEPIEEPSESLEESLVGLLPDLQEYIMLDWYR